MPDCPVDPAKYTPILKQTRRRRKYFFGTILLYIPALLVTHHFFPSDKAMGTLFGVWLVILIIVTVLVAISKCPRCGNNFHIYGITLLVLRKRLHCQLPISSDTLPEAVPAEPYHLQ
jgi:uncharacterized membrane protein HdeD (DUF308 family)